MTLSQQTLQDQIDSMRSSIRTDSYSMSVGELMNLYEKDELDVHPEFQRVYRWTDQQKTRFVESILLGIPIPQIFVSQRDDGKWDVIDGVQRLSCIFEFAGILRDEEGQFWPPLELRSTKYLPALEGKFWEHGEADHSFTMSQRLFVKRAKLDVSIVLKESNEFTKFELFQRLNRGGSLLTDQEVRSCILVMVNRDMYKWLLSLAGDVNFTEAVALTEKAIEEQYNLELILRFLVFRTHDAGTLKGIDDIGGYLTDKAVELAERKDFPFESEEKAFRKTFQILNDAVGYDAFRRYDTRRQRFVGGFLVSPFEAIALGVGYNQEHLSRDSFDYNAKVKDLWGDENFTANSGTGTNAARRIPHLIPLGRKLFKKI